MRFCKAHCRACDSHFTSTRAFDLHRAGSHQDNARYCQEPMDLAGVELVTDQATCRLHDPESPEVPIRLFAVQGYQEAGERIRASVAAKQERESV